jgi:hypothetical protein
LILEIVSLAMQKVFNLMQPHLSVLILLSWAIGVLFRKFLLMPISSSVFLL